MSTKRSGGILIKILFYFCAITLLIGGALFFVARQFDPKDFNLDPQDILSRYLGRECKINGPLSYTYFPWLGLTAEAVEIAQPKGFGTEPFVRIKRLEIRIKLMPLLLDRKIILGRIVLEEPRLLLIRDKQGRGNWKQWAFFSNRPPGKPSGKPSAEAGAGFDFESLTSNGVDVLNGSLVWDNQRSGSHYDVTGIELRTDAGLKFDYKLFCNYSSKLDNARGSLKAKGEGVARPELEELELQNSDMEFTARVDHGGGVRNYLLKGHGSMLVLSEAANLDSALLQLDEATLEGSLQGIRVFSDDISIHGDVRAHSLNLKALLGPDPAPAALALLHKATAHAKYSLKGDDLLLQDVDADLSGTRVTGSVAYHGRTTKKPSRWSADCAAGSLDLDALFPKDPKRTPQKSAAKEPVLPQETLEALRTANLDLKLRARKLLWRKTPLTDAALRLTASQGQVELQAAAQNVCQGALKGSFRSGAQKHSLQLALSGVDTAALLRLLGARPGLSGKGDVGLDAQFSGHTLGQLAATLQGQLRASLAKGGYASAPAGGPSSSTAQAASQAPPNASVWPFSSLKLELDAKAAPSDKNVVKPFEIKGKIRYKGLPPWLQAPRGNAQAPLRPVLDGLPESRLDADVRGTARFSLADQAVRGIDNAATRIAYTGHGGEALNYRRIEASGSGKLSYDVLLGTLDLKETVFSALGFTFQGDTHCTGLFGPKNKRIFRGRAEVSAARPRAALRTFLLELPIPRAPGVYRNWTLRTAYQLDQDALQCDNLLLRLDKSTLKGKCGVYGLSKPKARPYITFDLAADTLPLDDYRPLEKKRAPGYTPKVEDWDPEDIKKLHLDGKLSAAHVRLYELQAANLRAKIKAAGGKLEISSLKGRFYKGGLEGRATVEAPPQSSKLVFTTECTASNFQVGPMLNALGADNEVTGTGTLEARLAGAGRNWPESLATLGGRTAFIIRNGSVVIKRTAASATTPTAGRGKRRRREPLFNPKKGASPAAKTTRTSFDTARGVFNIAQGVMRNTDFLMQSTLLQAHGNGLVNLPAETIDYTITVQMTGAPSIPIRISGALQDPHVTVTHGIITDTAERIGGSIFDVFEGIFTLPFKAFDLLK